MATSTVPVPYLLCWVMHFSLDLLFRTPLFSPLVYRMDKDGERERMGSDDGSTHWGRERAFVRRRLKIPRGQARNLGEDGGVLCSLELGKHFCFHLRSPCDRRERGYKTHALLCPEHSDKPSRAIDWPELPFPLYVNEFMSLLRRGLLLTELFETNDGACKLDGLEWMTCRLDMPLKERKVMNGEGDIMSLCSFTPFCLRSLTRKGAAPCQAVSWKAEQGYHVTLRKGQSVRVVDRSRARASCHPSQDQYASWIGRQGQRKIAITVASRF